ncbi:hypothetical protein D3C81_1687100 [compost metagenome]
MALVAKSNTKGGRPVRGQAKASGLVPNTPLLPPTGATQAWLGVMAMPTSPCAAIASTSGQSAEKWKQLRITSAATPCLRACSTSTGRPIWKASSE